MDGGMDPDRVADHVLDGIRANDFYIITHPEHAGLVKDRSATLLRAFERAQVRDDGH
jgi:hypothetical protein